MDTECVKGGLGAFAYEGGAHGWRETRFFGRSPDGLRPGEALGRYKPLGDLATSGLNASALKPGAGTPLVPLATRHASSAVEWSAMQ